MPTMGMLRSMAESRPFQSAANPSCSGGKGKLKNAEMLARLFQDRGTKGTGGHRITPDFTKR